MVFSSTIFLLYFFPLFLLVYFLSPPKAKNYILLAFSILFYAWGAPKFIFILVGSTLVTWHIVRSMHRAGSAKQKKWLLIATLLLNVGILLYFKYANFFMENFNDVLGSFGISNLKWTAIALPIGISFYTFQSLSYCVDVYRGVRPPLQRASDFLLYIIMFPQLIAGPIVRFNTIAEQLTDRTSDGSDRILGFYRFTIGLAKKVLIANVMGKYADLYMSGNLLQLSSTEAWLGLLAYTFQIYFDFAGYSDMAIGIGRMLGFSFPENFNNPYTSRSITEFWRRWHITLSAWMRDYLYIPLGGSRVNTRLRLFMNLWIVFLISGLWHGASWNFVLWGAYHGLFLVLDRLFLKNLLDRAGTVIPTVFTFLVAVLGWVVFRLETFDQAMTYYGRLFAFDFQPVEIIHKLDMVIIMAIAFFFSFVTMSRFGRQLERTVYYDQYSLKRYLIMGAVVVLLFMLSVGSIAATGFNPFIYFRF
ncbi:MAG: MBOAT family protein [Bacteroidales bacterium]|nr:MBOAT family protein [Bacteroidales bacterium]MDT8432452.1 MBOAT family O-acyltransferase [Bacteroidales bacterium]